MRIVSFVGEPAKIRPLDEIPIKKYAADQLKLLTKYIRVSSAEMSNVMLARKSNLQSTLWAA